MKKSKGIVIFLSVLCLIGVLMIGGIMLWSDNTVSEPEITVAENVDISWYDENGKEFQLTTAEELYGLAELSKIYDFKGQTIKLGADIVINEGNASEWAKQAPEKLWNPIAGFAGTFDGQGHTISGIYGNSIVTSLGLFTDTQKGCVIRNLNLVNSCFKNNNDMGTGSIIGIGGGKLENVYSDAVLVSSGENVGGLIGCVKTKGENLISNCWFDGTITMDGYGCSKVGGLVGAYTIEDAINTIEHSLSTADISCMGENVGGICGNVGSGAFLNINDSMFTGTLAYDANKYAVVGSVIGQVMGSGSIIINDTYTVDELANRTIGTSSGYQKGNAIALDKNYLLGVAGYQWTTLDFDRYWVAQKDGMPRLGYYTTDAENIDGVQKMVDVSWYDPTSAAFEITNVQQLYGFAYLSRSYDFRGQTIKLGADITVNEGDASTWRENAPAYNWTPIAWYGSSLSQRFKGTFDGQGHTVSGIYCKGTENITSLGFFGEVYHGAVVKNFKLVNSYFEGVLDISVRGPVGSVAGRLRGTIEDVYSDAILVNSAKNTGGIVGMVTGSGQNKISGCWFNGEINGMTRSGGILGGVYGNKGNIEATIEHCLNTGVIRVEAGQAAVGGICGSAETWSILYVDDCLNLGFYGTTKSDKESSAHVGTLVGTVTQTDGVGSKAVITDSYGEKDFYSRLVGWKYDDEGLSQCNVSYVNRQELIGYGGYKWTTLSFDDHWSVRGNACPVPVAFAPKKMSTAGLVRMVDYSWYDPAKSTYTIYNFQQLYGVARLWDIANQFKGKTIKLGADIVLNEGDASQWGENAPEYVWEPMRFNGTFDGQGHTISGIYVKGGEEDNYVGFFYRIYQNGTVKNLKLTNSYIEGTMAASERGAVGSLAGRSNGVIDTVYSNAIVVNSARMTGGLVGMITGEGANTIRNSWFDGKITGITRTGGILGGMYGNKQDIEVTIEHCANTGNIAVPRSYGDVGGICGMAETGGTIYIWDCLNTGTYTPIDDGKTANTHIGTVFGSVTKSDDAASRIELSNAYGVQEFYNKLVGWAWTTKDSTGTVTDTGTSSSDSKAVSADKIKGYDAYYAAKLDYESKPYWVLKEDAVPVLAAFNSGETLSVEEAKKRMDTSWYDEAAEEYIITTKQQLMGFNSLCTTENDYFKGKTIKLGADIALTGGSETVPNWIPQNFSGTFDGQGHTISGLYVNSTKQYTGFFGTVNSGATVKNLKLIDSYIEGNGSATRSGVGSIAGRSHGTIDAVYSNAILKNSKQMTGGIVGMITGAGQNKITNCWFDGQITAINGTGGILGSSYGQTATIAHCLNTGALNVSSGSQVGGIVGYVQGAANVTVTDSLNAGTLAAASDVKQIGTIVGSLHNSATLELENAYGVQEFKEKAVGYISTGKLKDSGYAVRNLADIMGYGAYQWTSLDFDNGTWVLKKDAIPALGVFDTSDLNLGFAQTLPDYSWYDEGKTEFVITTAVQLRGFNELCEKNDFTGKTITLGSDISLADEKWTPANFGGIFNGNGKTISGLTGGLFNKLDGATVQNLKLDNSIAAEAANSTVSTCVLTNAGADMLGIAGENVTLEHCYSDGGLIADVQGTTTVSDSLAAGKIVDSAVDGKLTMTNVYGIGDVNGSVSVGGASYIVRKRADIQGYGAYQYTKLDFESGTWVLKKDNIPMLGAFASADLSVEDAKTLPTYDWYDTDAQSYTISNIQQMRGYAEICGNADFVKKPIILGADLYVLTSGEQLHAFAALCADGADFTGKTVQLGSDVALTEWIPVSFGGTFDGQKHTISGLTGSLFSKLDGATVQNLRLDNSIAAEAANSNISCCILTNAEASILGIAKDGTRLELCYSDGGLIADVQGMTVVNDSLAAGTPVTSAAADKLTMTNVYGIGNTNGSVSLGGASYIVRKQADLLGYGAYQWTKLDFAGGNWVLKNGAIPALGAFDTTDLSLEEAKKLPDYNWYDESADAYVMSSASQMASYVSLSKTAGFVDKPVKLDDTVYLYAISTAEELLAFNSLCNADTDYFKGKTVQLNNSITLTGGSETERNWMHQEFKGTFDGNGCTISGVYVVATTHAGFFKLVHDGAIVKDLKLVNSCIVNNTASGRSGTGSIAGRCYGTIENVYSSATVKSNKGALMTGGIVGLIDKAGDNKISNCWFDGTIYGTGSTGGILGGTYATTATLEHCLNTGTLVITTGGANRTAIGGLCGYAQSSGGVTIRDSLNAGAIQQNPSGSNTIKQIGTIIGAIHGNATSTTVANVYGATEFMNKLYGYGTAKLESDTVCEMASIADYYGSGAAKLDFNTWWTARESMIPMLKRFS